MARGLLDVLREAVGRYELVRPGDTVLVAVSGGADSVALLAALLDLRTELGITVVAGHLDHGLRGDEGAADRAFVERLAAELGVRIRSDAVHLPPGNVEAEARHARYAFLERAADKLGATKIATAHTADDQAETVLLRLLRGAGRRGLGGIRPRRGRVIRPLILCDRVQVRSFLVDRRLSWQRDRSNFDLAYHRTRVRLGYLPALAHEFNPRLARSLARLAEVMREEDALLDRLAAAAAGRGPELGLAMLRALESALARRAVLRWWRRHGSGRRLGRSHVEAALAVARRECEGEVRVPGGAIVRDRTGLRFRAGDGAPPAPPYTFPLVPGASLEVPGGWRLRLTEEPPGTITGSDTVCIIDGDRVAEPLTVRNRRPGDRVRAQGLGGRSTIKRLFIARGVPRALRANHPLVLTGAEILWVPGCARSERALVSAETRRMLVVRCDPPSR